MQKELVFPQIWFQLINMKGLLNMLSTLQITHYQQLPLDYSFIHFIAIWKMANEIAAEKVKYQPQISKRKNKQTQEGDERDQEINRPCP